MRLKAVGNFLLIDVGESDTKPHRSSADKLYYYRHETQSEKMPEVMIAALYRSQSVLKTKSSVFMTRFGTGHSQSIYINAWIKNESRIAGTNPRVQIQLFSNIARSLKYTGLSVADFEKEQGSFVQPFQGLNGIKWNGVFSTNLEFQQLILYPEDTLSFSATAQAFPNNPNKELSRFFIVRVDTMFMECARQVSYALIDLDHPDGEGKAKSKVITHSSPSDTGGLIATYLHLLNANPK